MTSWQWYFWPRDISPGNWFLTPHVIRGVSCSVTTCSRLSRAAVGQKHLMPPRLKAGGPAAYYLLRAQHLWQQMMGLKLASLNNEDFRSHPVCMRFMLFFLLSIPCTNPNIESDTNIYIIYCCILIKKQYFHLESGNNLKTFLTTWFYC